MDVRATVPAPELCVPKASCHPPCLCLLYPFAWLPVVSEALLVAGVYEGLSAGCFHWMKSSESSWAGIRRLPRRILQHDMLLCLVSLLMNVWTAWQNADFGVQESLSGIVQGEDKSASTSAEASTRSEASLMPASAALGNVGSISNCDGGVSTGFPGAEVFRSSALRGGFRRFKLAVGVAIRSRRLCKPCWQDWKRGGRYGWGAPGVRGGVAACY